MVQRRRPRARRRTRTKGSVRPKTKVDKSLSRRITKLEKAPEIKYLDYTSTASPTTGGVGYSLINHMDDGPDYNERIGNKITAKRVYIQFRLAFDSLPMQYRIIIGWDKQTNGGATLPLFTGSAPATELLSTALLDNRSGMVTVNAPYNQNTKERYKILYDRVFNINPNNITEAGPTFFNVKKMINLNNAIVLYSDGDQTIDALPSKNLFAISYFSLYTGNAPQLNFTSRFFYTDT